MYSGLQAVIEYNKQYTQLDRYVHRLYRVQKRGSIACLGLLGRNKEVQKIV